MIIWILLGLVVLYCTFGMGIAFALWHDSEVLTLKDVCSLVVLWPLMIKR